MPDAPTIDQPPLAPSSFKISSRGRCDRCFKLVEVFPLTNHKTNHNPHENLCESCLDAEVDRIMAENQPTYDLIKKVAAEVLGG